MSASEPSAANGTRIAVSGAFRARRGRSKGFGSGVRRWEYDGVEMVGLTDDVRSAGIVGTERIYRADTPCELVREVKKSRRRTR